LTSASTFRLNCLIFGDDVDGIFTVQVTSDQSIIGLKTAIKDKKRIDAWDLKLWKVSIAVENGFEENVKKEKCRAEEKLLPVYKLSEVFTVQPNDRHLHIIVVCKPPPGECECFVQSDDSD
jgi:hypothetical protein